jgi:hypothetical protein
MKDLSGQIRDRLMAQVPALKYVDEDWGQLDYFNRPPVKYPCALINVWNVNYTNTGNRRQAAKVAVRVSIYSLRLSNSSNGAPETQKANVAQMWQLYEDVNRAMHGVQFLTDGYGAMMRTLMTRNKRQDGSIEISVEYVLSYNDVSCMPVYAEATAELRIKNYELR